MSRYLSVPLAAIGVSALVLRGSFHRVEHVLLALSGDLHRLRPLRLSRSSRLGRGGAGDSLFRACRSTATRCWSAVATLGTTLAPWGLAFVQSYAVDKRLEIKDLGYERVDVVVGAVLTGVIGGLRRGRQCRHLHVSGIDQGRKRCRPSARAARRTSGVDAFRARLPWRGVARRGGRAAVDRILASEALEVRGDVDDTFKEAPVFYATSSCDGRCAAAIVLIPGAPLIPILFLSQALNAILLLVLLPFMRRLARDRGGDGRARERSRRAVPDGRRARPRRGLGHRPRRVTVTA